MASNKSGIGIVSLVLFVTSCATLSAQVAMKGTWASEKDADAKMMIEAERKWGVEDCVPSNVVEEYLADDFVGTSPDGPIYTKADMMKKHTVPTGAHDCKLLSARVRYFGPTIAIIYGSETEIRKDAAGKDVSRTLIWTDTWMKRNGKWQIIAVQDMNDPKK